MKKLLFLLCLAQAAFGAITLTVTAGNGQLVPANFGMNSKPIVINVQNSGTPVAGATVTIACTIGGSSTPAPLNTTTPVTDASGNATVLFLPGIQTSGQYIMQYTCTGTYSAVTASFISTGYYTSPTLVPGVYFYRLLPSAAAMNPYTAAAGSAGTPIKIEVVRSDTIQPVANVAVRLLPQPDGTAGTQQVITVAEGTGAENSVLTDANGYATLTPTFTYPQSAQSSSYETFKIDLGSFNAYGPFQTNILAANSSVLPSSPPATAPNPGVGAHTKWRVQVAWPLNHGLPVTFSEIEFYDANGTRIPTSGGQPVASSTVRNDVSGSLDYLAEQAFDGNLATVWTSTYSYFTGFPAPQWVEYVFPAPVNVASAFITQTDGGSDPSPTDFAIQYGDGSISAPAANLGTDPYNAHAYADSASLSNATASIHETQWMSRAGVYTGWGFAIASPPAGYYLSYRVNVSAITTPGSYVQIKEIGIAGTIGGATLTTIAGGKNGYASTDGGGGVSGNMEYAFDQNAATYWQPTTTNTGWIAYNFHVPTQAASVTITPQATATAPTAFTIEGSNDGGQTWTVLSTCSMTWSTTTPQTCNIAPVAGAPPTSTINGNTSTVAERGHIDFDQIALDARHGDGTKIQTSDLTGVSGHCAMYGTFGALTDSGVVCGGGTPAATGVSSIGFTAPTADFTTTPSAPATGNVTIGITKTLPWSQCAVTFSATPVFDFTLCGSDTITLTGNVTSSTAIGLTAGHYYTFLISQDATGSRTFVWPTNVKGATTIGSTLSKTNVQAFISDGTNLYAIGAGVINQ